MEIVIVILFWGGIFMGPPITGIIIAILIYRWLSKRNFKKVSVIFSIIAFSFLIYYVAEIYLAFYPPENFYKADFEYYSKLKFPKSGEFISKYATYPDFHGHYHSQAFFKFTEHDFESLIDSFNYNHSATIDTLDSNINEIINNHTYIKEIDRPIDLTNSAEKRNVKEIVQIQKMKVIFMTDKTNIIIVKGL